jgi:hypothetical protein
MVKHRLSTRWSDDREDGRRVCGLYHAQGDEEHGFLGLASKPRSMVSPGLATKQAIAVLMV